MGEANASMTIEHDTPNQFIDMSIEKWLGVTHRRKRFEEGGPAIVDKLHVKVIIAMPHRALIVMHLCA